MKYLREITCERVGLNEHTPHQVTAYSDGRKHTMGIYYRGSYRYTVTVYSQIFRLPNFWYIPA